LLCRFGQSKFCFLRRACVRVLVDLPEPTELSRRQRVSYYHIETGLPEVVSYQYQISERKSRNYRSPYPTNGDYMQCIVS